MKHITVNNDAVAIDCGLTKDQVTHLRTELLTAFADSSPRVVSLAAVDGIDAAGIQLLVSMTKSWPYVSFVDTPAVVLSTLARVGALDIVEVNHERS